MSTAWNDAIGSARTARPLNFDRLARVYRWMEWLSFGPYLWRARCAFMAEMRGARRALALGDGDGRFTAALLEENAKVLVDAVDVSTGMIRSLRRAAGHAGRLRTEVRDVREWVPAAGAEYDLVVTHFFLDCLTTDEVRDLALRVRVCLQPGVRWVVSEFAVPGGVFGRLVARPVVGFLYWAFGLLTGLQVRRLPDWRGALAGAGFSPVREQQWLRGLLVSELWCCMPMRGA
jgi:SAM-dependent methyltransferase